MSVRLWTVALLGVTAMNGCSGAEAAERPSRPLAETTATTVVRDTTVTTSFAAAGLALPVQRATLSTRLMATVTAMLVKEGDIVRPGAVLARLDARDLEAKRQQVDAGLSGALAMQTEASAQARRIRALYDDSAATRVQLDQVESGLARAEAGVATARAAQAELDAVSGYATIRAPFGGTVTRRLVDPGAFAAPGAPLLEIQDGSRLRITVAVPPVVAQRLQPGQRLSGSIEGQPVEAVVEGVVPAGAGAMSSLNLLVDNRAGRYLPMSSATIAVPGETRRVLVVPSGALVRQGDLTGVRVREGDGLVLRWVTLGDMASTDGSPVEIRSGLRGGDIVAVEVP